MMVQLRGMRRSRPKRRKTSELRGVRGSRSKSRLKSRCGGSSGRLGDEFDVFECGFRLRRLRGFNLGGKEGGGRK